MKPSQQRIAAQLRDLRKLIDSSEDPVEFRIAYGMETAICWRRYSRRKFRRLNKRQRKKMGIISGGPYWDFDSLKGYDSVRELAESQGGFGYQAVPVGQPAIFSGLDAKTTYDAKFITTDADNGIMHMWLTKR